MNILRSKSRLTKILLLLELINDRHSILKTIATNLDITSQAVSDYFHQMREEGYIENQDGFYTATNEGMLFLQDNLLSLKSFVDEKLSTLSIIRSTNAIADTNLKKGERVYLFMKEGLLFASVNEVTPSHGIASENCPKDSVLMVEQLEGILDMNPGKLTLVSLPENGTKITHKDEILDLITENSEKRIAALDLEAIAILRENGIFCHLEFATFSTLRDNLHRGIDIFCLGMQKNIQALREDIAEHNKRSNYKVEARENY
jgi:putative transcriptional regulator